MKKTPEKPSSVAGIISTPISRSGPQKSAKMCTFFVSKNTLFFHRPFFQSFLAHFFIMNRGYPPPKLGQKGPPQGHFQEKCTPREGGKGYTGDLSLLIFFSFFEK